MTNSTSAGRDVRTRRAVPPMLRPGTGRNDWLAFGVGAIAVVLAFGLILARTPGMTRIDMSISVALTRLHTGAIGALGSAVYKIFSPVEAITLTALIAVAILVVSRNLRLAATFAALVAITWIPSDIVKILVHRLRPDADELPHHLTPMPTDPSYPSGHMVFVTTLVIAVVLLARGSRWSALATGLGAVVVVVVALCLVTDGVHYASDVIASIVWSLGVAPFVLELWNRYVLPRTYRL
ncbi:phosphatase PAP2 family protein [Frondihabitans australicus]|uniref:PAP2 superfamily protein n=1 Tax=Frondihabitans australicus TaxID=386892 RepID=A0A495IDE5_9MICO|nr:phosphatase PAP2 family protein [Frondihabitans australicus]RKR73341.1 PAP2 superfamily protein [Frondihabitans australicus]